MRVARIYTGEDARSHFEDLDIPMEPSALGTQSSLMPGDGIMFREAPAGGSLDFHPAPQRQFVVTLAGVAELECGDGTRRRFGAGDVMLADDTSGQGHITRVVEGPRRYIFVPVQADLDISTWRA
jgi:hypothetical protein